MRRSRAGAMRGAFNPFSAGGRQGIDKELRQIAASILENRPIGIIPAMPLVIAIRRSIRLRCLVAPSMVLLLTGVTAVGLGPIPVHRIALRCAHATVL